MNCLLCYDHRVVNVSSKLCDNCDIFVKINAQRGINVHYEKDIVCESVGTVPKSEVQRIERNARIRREQHLIRECKRLFDVLLRKEETTKVHKVLSSYLFAEE